MLYCSKFNLLLNEVIMLENFVSNENNSQKINSENLRKNVEEIFQIMGENQTDSKIATDALILADLRGVESHGISNMLRIYIEGYRNEEIKPQAKLSTIKDNHATCSVDGDRGLGIITTPKAMDIAIAKAKTYGISMVTIKNSRHLGMASYHAIQAMKHKMIGMCVTSCPPQVLPTFGAEPLLGTNPIAIAAPAGEKPPYVFDAAMSTIAANKVSISKRLGNNLLPGWISDNDGAPIMEEFNPEEYKVNGENYLLPLGSTRELGSHKGFGLAGMVDILGGILSGGGYGANPGRPNFGHMVTAYNIDSFTDYDEYTKTMDEWLDMLENSKTIPGKDKVIYPGLPEHITQIERTKNGIPIHNEVLDWFEKINKELVVSHRIN